MDDDYKEDNHSGYLFDFKALFFCLTTMIRRTVKNNPGSI